MNLQMRPELSLMIGESLAMRSLREDIGLVANSETKVVIQGETGTGKELVAKELHNHSHRAHGPFVTVNCAGLTETLLESELFGHTRGSFTGAYRDRTGQIEAAHQGTLFLDEIGEMTQRMQGLLLRFLQNGEVRKVGSDESHRGFDVRTVCATHRDLNAMVKANEFREDLYYRLNVVTLVVSPLRERKGDIPLLADHFLQKYNAEARSHRLSHGGGNGVGHARLSTDAMDRLCQYDWPGNVRELQNIIERLVATVRKDVITAQDLSSALPAPLQPRSSEKAVVTSTTAEELFQRMVKDGESFSTIVWRPFMERDLTRDDVKQVIRLGLLQTRGNYKLMAGLFHVIEDRSAESHVQYKRFLSTLRKQQCALDFREFRSLLQNRPTNE